jgi:2-oxoisovalerate dehydrogenase E1 component
MLDDLELYRRMLVIRRTEEKLLQLHSQGLLSGTTHTSIGQESIAVGLLSRLGPDDAIFSTHRCHGHFLASGGDLGAFLAELMGKADGVCGGRGGSQHLHAAVMSAERDGSSRPVPGSVAFLSSGIQGQLVPVALGVALAKKLRGEDGIAVVFIGDGTLGQGALYESMNLASLWDVRLLIVLEDNAIAQTTPSSVGVAGDMLARAEAFGIDAARLEGVDAPALQQEFAALVETMRGRAAPVFRVVRTVRLGPHSKRDDERSAEEMAELWTRDPVTRLAAMLDPADVEAADRDAVAQLDGELAFAEASPEPDQLAHLVDVNPPLDEAAAVGSWARPVEEPRVVESLNAALHDLVERDPSVRVFGQDLLDPYGGAFAVTKGLSTRFPDRVHPTPISETAIVGSATGFALAGGTAVAEIMFGDFVALAADQLANSAAKHYYLSQGEAAVNLVVRVPMGGGRGYGPTHSQSLEKMFFGIPGLRVVAVSSFVDPYALLWNAVEADPGPVLFIENKAVYAERARHPHDGLVDHFSARTTGGVYPNVRLSPIGFEDPDLTVIAYGRCASLAWEPVRQLFIERELAAELCVVSQLSPLDLDGILPSALASECVVTVEEAPGEAGFGSEVAARLAEAGFRGRFARIAAAASPIPAAKSLEDVVLPTGESIRRELERLAVEKGALTARG